MDLRGGLWQHPPTSAIQNPMRVNLLRPITSLSVPGLVIGAVCFAAALTPSLVPRAGIFQGALAGASFAAGYCIGFLIMMTWRLLHLREPHREREVLLSRIVLVAAGLIVVWSLTRASTWQDELHHVMGMPAVESVRPFTIAASAALMAGVLILIGRLFRHATLRIAHRLAPLMPERLALLLGFVAAVLVFNFIGNDLILRRGFQAFDASYQALDQNLHTISEPPSDPLKTGSADSLLEWDEIGAEGRARVADPLDADAIAAISGAPAREPLRVYVGLGSAIEAETRAELALQEAIRIGAFDRGMLVIATPTGTGWVDPAAMMPLEVLTRGDVATISVQYSYLPSWLSLLSVPEYGRETARATFAAIHGYWSELPPATRPRLYLFGLSLGAMNSDLSADFFDLIGAPYQGALWAGPPFSSRSWRQVTDERRAGSPEWLPQFRDGSVVRFMNQHQMPHERNPWGPLRIVYLQYASDPITFFSPSILWRQPDWMRGPRGPDVIAEFRWLPLVTFLQTGFDVMTATATPRGFGHVYAGQDYLQGWIALLSPEGWDDEGLLRLRQAMTDRGL